MTSSGATPRLSKENAPIGVFGRLIENWLTNTPERGFELPFCQLLLSEGHRIIHVDSHSPNEQGKDILSFDAEQRLCGFQLKAGNISVSEWRKVIEGELRELVGLAAHHPSVRDRLVDKAYFVITGRMSEPALSRLAQLNVTLKKRRIELVDGQALLHRFLKCQRELLPESPADFKTFLELLVADGGAGLDKPTFARQLRLSLSARPPNLGTGQKARGLAAGMVTAGHMLSQATTSNNHWAVSEGWTLAAAECAYSGQRSRLAKNRWMPAVELAKDEAVRAIHRLADEAVEAPELFVPSMRGDGGYIWMARAMMVSGIVSASRLILNRPEEDSRYSERVMQWLPKSYPWGEYGFPFVAATYWFLRRRIETSRAAESFLLSYVRFVSQLTMQKNSRGFPNPYYSVEQCLMHMVDGGADIYGDETFAHMSYSLLPAVLCLVKAGRRQALSDLWYEICAVNHCHMKFRKADDMLRFHSDDGTLYSHFLPKPTSWKALQAQVARYERGGTRALPQLIRDDIPYALLFFLSHPHRATPQLTTWLNLQLQLGADTAS